MNSRSKKENFLKLGIFLFVGALFIATWVASAAKYSKFTDVRWFFYIAAVYSFIVFVHFIYRAALGLFYKTAQPSADFMPSLSIIIPAFNEGKTIKQCLRSAIDAQYPGTKEILVVNDGSTDDTAFYIKELQNDQLYSGKFKFLSLEKNLGKRAAIACGVESSSGDIIVLIDSDTSIDKDSLPHLVAPFRDKKVGATTGSVRVLNEKENFLTRILSVRYIIAFDFYRISHSVIKTVMVCSGVLSAYRKDILVRVMKSWTNQYFLGKRCTYGDDRSLTNFVIRLGFDTVYVYNSYAYTIVPSTLKKLARMVSRWNKSYIRENIVFMSFIFKRFKKRYKPLAIFDFIFTNLVMVLQYAAFLSAFVYFIYHPIYILKFIVMITLITAFYMVFYMRFRRNTDYFYGFLYSYLVMILLAWTLPYAFFTLKDDSWLTR